MSFADTLSLLSSVASVTTILALMPGGWWHMLVHQHSNAPRAKLAHSIKHKRTFYQKTLLTVDIYISNVSTSLLLVRSSKTYVKQMPPISARDDSAPKERGDALNLVAFQAEDWGDKGLRIEPGETRHLLYTFFIDASIQTVSVYTHVRPVERWLARLFRRRQPRQGWRLTSIHDCHLPASEGSSMIKTKASAARRRCNIAVEHYKGMFPRGILVKISNCEPHEPLEMLFYAGTDHVTTMRVTASHDGEAHVSLNWKPNTHGRVLVRSNATNNATEIRF